ncbi:ABC transporter substrate-binding protein [Herbaspirillum sp. ST 5-3]|uniref:ABC transporter substrate-binding protein n=1 Tax=Oxalobacteraceae TaxID=75682 RepID=UPI0010A3C52F|nr:ABC transporter substrate-binding protein [Herbaspirillum sp. ST 5-3]
MKRTNKLKKIALSLALTGSFVAMGSAHAETGKVVFAYQTGWAYLPIHVMNELKLVEKHAKALGVNVTTEYKALGTPGMINDAMNANQVDFGTVGIPSLVTLNDKTKGQYKAVGAIVDLPMYLNTTASYKSICEFKEGDKIALPTVKVSVQAVTLQMAAKQQCGDPYKLDKFTISSTHPDGFTSLMSGNVIGHFTSPPFQYSELKDKKVKTLVSSYDVLGGKSSFISLVGKQTFADANPKVQKAVYEALVEAQEWINKSKIDAAKLYFKVEQPKNQTMDEVLGQLTDKEIEFTAVPHGIEKYSKFMNEIGTAKSNATWKDLTFPAVHNKKGS